MSIFYYVPAVLGVFFIAVGIWHGWRLRALTRHCTAPATGTVMQFDVEKNKSGDMYYPVVRFSVHDKQYTARYTFGNSEWSFEAGNTVDLRYNPSRPEEIYLYHEQSTLQQYASPVMIIVGGLIFIATYYIEL